MKKSLKYCFINLKCREKRVKIMKLDENKVYGLRKEMNKMLKGIKMIDVHKSTRIRCNCWERRGKGWKKGGSF